MPYILKPLQWLYCIYACGIFIAIMLVLFPFAILASFMGKIKGGNAIFKICMIWADAWFPLIFIFPKRYFEVPHDKTRPYIFVTNHISLLDAALLPKAYRQPVRPLGKVEMSKIPVFGFIYRKAIVTVDRGDAADRAHSIRILKSIIKRGISVLIFPEGTYNMTHQPLKEFYTGAFRIAIETQTPIKPVLFLDAYDRMRYQNVFSFIPGKCRIVFLEEIPVDGLTPADVETLKQRVFDVMSSRLSVYKASWIGAVKPREVVDTV